MQDKLIYPDLSYKILGILFDIHKELGPHYPEKFYQRAVAVAFDRADINYKRELKMDLKYRDRVIGRYYLDFLVENKIVLELKCIEEFSREDIGQVLRYLRAKKLKLGILVNFRNKSLRYKRIINSD